MLEGYFHIIILNDLYGKRNGNCHNFRYSHHNFHHKNVYRVSCLGRLQNLHHLHRQEQ